MVFISQLGRHVGDHPAIEIQKELIRANPNINNIQVHKIKHYYHIIKVVCEDTETADAVIRDGLHAFHTRIAASQCKKEQSPQTCHPRPAFRGIAFRAREVERHLLDLDPNGGVDPSGCFPLFFRKTASVLAPKLSCLFRRLLRGGEFLLEWRIADVTPIPKGPLSALVCNYRPISITLVLSKVFERLIALHFGRFWRDLGSCLLNSIHTGRDWLPVMLFLTSSVLVS